MDRPESPPGALPGIHPRNCRPVPSLHNSPDNFKSLATTTLSPSFHHLTSSDPPTSPLQLYDSGAHMPRVHTLPPIISPTRTPLCPSPSAGAFAPTRPTALGAAAAATAVTPPAPRSPDYEQVSNAPTSSGPDRSYSAPVKSTQWGSPSPSAGAFTPTRPTAMGAAATATGWSGLSNTAVTPPAPHSPGYEQVSNGPTSSGPSRSYSAPVKSTQWGSDMSGGHLRLVRTPIKRALIVGIQYRSTENELMGARGDTIGIYSLLLSQAYPKDQIRILSDAEDLDLPYVYEPTAAMLKEALVWLVNGLKRFDSVFFSFSGHGGILQLDNQSNQQFIWPVDYATNGYLSSDDLAAYLVRPIPDQARLVAVIDCCFCGTMLDLQFSYDLLRHTWVDSLPDTAKNSKAREKAQQIWKRVIPLGTVPVQDSKLHWRVEKEKKAKNNDSVVIVMAACLDDEVCFELDGVAYGLPISGGNMTNAFISAVGNLKPLGGTWHELATNIQYNIESISRAGHQLYKQNSRVSCNQDFNMEDNFAL